jgi:hypothetical protein
VCVLEKREMYKGFWWENLKKGDNLEDLGINGNLI